MEELKLFHGGVQGDLHKTRPSGSDFEENGLSHAPPDFLVSFKLFEASSLE